MNDEIVRFLCSYCGQKIDGSAEQIGTETHCPTCGKSFRLERIGVARSAKTGRLKCYLGMFRQYAVFKGRTCRREFWWALLFHFIVSSFVCFIADWQECLELCYLVVVLLPLSALHVRRLHDTNKSGWWIFLLFLPVLNIACIVWLATDGDRGRNRFGNDPKGR